MEIEVEQAPHAQSPPQSSETISVEQSAATSAVMSRETPAMSGTLPGNAMLFPSAPRIEVAESKENGTAGLASTSPDSSKPSEADEHELSRSLVMEYLLQNCYRRTAEAFAKAIGGDEIRKMPRLMEDLMLRREILLKMSSGQILDAVETADKFLAKFWTATERTPRVVDMFPSLYFELGCQHFVELVRKTAVDEALWFAQQTLAPLSRENKEHMAVLQDLTVLLAYSEPERSPVGSLLALERRERLSKALNARLFGVCHPRAKTAHLNISDAEARSTLELVIRQKEACDKETRS